MSIENTESLLLKVKQRVDDLERMARNLNHLDSVFHGMDFPLPKTIPPELGFMRAVGWLYALYYETGKPSVIYLLEMMENLKCGNYEEAKYHFKIIPILRTLLQHNLDPRSETDMQTAREGGQWLRIKCGTCMPEKDTHWETALKALLKNALEYLNSCFDLLRIIENDENRENMLMDWKIRVDRFHPAHLFDEIISRTAQDMGLANIEIIELRKRNYQKWQNRLNMLEIPYDFITESRKLIEQTLMSDDLYVLPITGKDVMEHFQIEPGPKVGEILRIAQNLHKSKIMGKKELLRELDNRVEK